ncbi:hypothetical protein PCANC_04179 [Puccinia coronata f. sp. avenae]|uniref:Uncharacterized protein n=1 Tax=Puccinia coronata f. sp. avenae TaxID=200324 RepID=A0A2N5W7A4_9BASI|nr:hypothetical protein PCANC_04179 [Puccinia coronata f. sp. avenae]
MDPDQAVANVGEPAQELPRPPHNLLATQTPSPEPASPAASDLAGRAEVNDANFNFGRFERLEARVNNLADCVNQINAEHMRANAGSPLRDAPNANDQARPHCEANHPRRAAANEPTTQTVLTCLFTLGSLTPLEMALVRDWPAFNTLGASITNADYICAAENRVESYNALLAKVTELKSNIINGVISQLGSRGLLDGPEFEQKMALALEGSNRICALKTQIFQMRLSHWKMLAILQHLTNKPNIKQQLDEAAATLRALRNQSANRVVPSTHGHNSAVPVALTSGFVCPSLKHGQYMAPPSHMEHTQPQTEEAIKESDRPVTCKRTALSPENEVHSKRPRF